ncbi:MAG: flagellar basal body rod protein FlgB [Pseudodesulfovibrio sp.]|uniref:Flagellar basal body rod protein FlgB n=1 Tax=Pseudodesulfovibrio aespoeensis (strain ATCC 700646 / DSM 10631 / Aspo-2) TaxID=643562 RepID=E6VRI0_PSEA9|nr:MULTISPECIES: flagellar basal body rod protein FlgB [Pseudodesulfovibrio]MBU4191257.1 flagellar basal body rod protein FlgB [Pseudomonadota bacterium]ADU63017.1 flagellar basal-body rod protein FlgB [Pseudodesulfovibrio aespoeensis Aspo-2]MBU4377783.1 flagellar basal body rod protein FlgB [Pseudomonadota bacterium]MBU4475878.1 flagellar basal body rod protein FlgB [Pseudomonadota bacterium]MBU4516716.1 flagellar basal body rod protein FlgB [Pseudomonadota bacterium]
MKGLFGNHIQLTAKVLDLRLERQNVVMGNISNVDTPEYKARRLEFEDKLQQALNHDARGKMTRTQQSHLPAVFNADGFQGDGIKDFKPRHVHGEDSVDMDKEMAIMGKNGLMYNALASVIKKNFEGLQKVIMEGGK